MSSMLRVIQQRCAFHKPLISKPIYSYALPQSELLGNGAITPSSRWRHMHNLSVDHLRLTLHFVQVFNRGACFDTHGMPPSTLRRGGLLSYTTSSMHREGKSEILPHLQFKRRGDLSRSVQESL